ncbi:LysR family transcriptional regulator [Bradyrhizobium sp.]|uniref:LysR family transcriptional regulator n=1 Tax=Bradyrhizobium sp. TaxID=376 RepID=UPI00261E66BE|nr:LysR family transcriptional regulator [Bradyrhizobium sp.]
MDQLAALATFVRVVETGSLSKAARSLSSSLTSVSRKLSALEQHFGIQFVRRTTRRLTLTDEGRMLYERAKAVLAELKQIETSLTANHQEPTGRLRVSVPTLIGRALVAPVLAEFLRLYPSLSIDLQLVDRAVDMLEEDIHVALRIGHLPNSQLIVRKLADIQMIVCAAPCYLKRRGTPTTPAELSEHDCLAFSETPGLGEWHFGKEAKPQSRVAISPRLWINSLDALVLAAEQGAGVVRVPSWLVKRELSGGRLVRVLRDFEPPPAPLNVLFQSARLASPKTRVFADYLAERWRRLDPFGSRPTRSSVTNAPAAERS